jgi:hypothetical protein
MGEQRLADRLVGQRDAADGRDLIARLAVLDHGLTRHSGPNVVAERADYRPHLVGWAIDDPDDATSMAPTPPASTPVLAREIEKGRDHSQPALPVLRKALRRAELSRIATHGNDFAQAPASRASRRQLFVHAG